MPAAVDFEKIGLKKLSYVRDDNFFKSASIFLLEGLHCIYFGSLLFKMLGILFHELQLLYEYDYEGTRHMSII